MGHVSLTSQSGTVNFHSRGYLIRSAGQDQLNSGQSLSYLSSENGPSICPFVRGGAILRGIFDLRLVNLGLTQRPTKVSTRT